ncbi:CDP-glycerol glycerophosphotransferase family protein [Leucobacter sp. USHLN153]|uniref:CDP-glycerol glycerophosphotransferase family protein n=1 Tax=Leucobacter sp. USHLN153 TaxID=3081268 RepID=UPI00301AABDC
MLTTVVLALSKPHAARVAIATLNADEENATVTAVQLAAREPRLSITYISPDPDVARLAVAEAARCLEVPVPAAVTYVRDRYVTLLRAFASSRRTFTTHVMLPGIDPSGRRVHTHLTHGSGPKPDSTFRGPTTVLASITDVWVPSQLREYRLPPTTPVVREMPRLEVMRRAAGDRTIFTRLGLNPDHPVVVWAPTYRAIQRSGGEIRVSGRRFALGIDEERQRDETGLTLASFQSTIKRAGWTLIAKPHPRDADDFRGLGLPVFTNEELRSRGVTPYELFGATDLLITDYSSVFTEREELGLPYALWRPDLHEFAESYRGFRKPHFVGLHPKALVNDQDTLEQRLAGYSAALSEIEAR